MKAACRFALPAGVMLPWVCASAAVPSEVGDSVEQMMLDGCWVATGFLTAYIVVMSIKILRKAADGGY